MTNDYFIFVPAYNVERKLCEVLSKIDESVLSRTHVLVIDDGSCDGTAVAYQKFIESDYLNTSEDEDSLKNHFEYLKFEKNKGYGTKAHYEGIEARGICPIHRKTFLKKILEK